MKNEVENYTFSVELKIP